MNGEVHLAELEIDQIVFAGQIADSLEFRGAELAPAFQPVEIFLDLGTDRPGVLIGVFGLEAPRSGLERTRIGRTHVET